MVSRDWRHWPVLHFWRFPWPPPTILFDDTPITRPSWKRSLCSGNEGKEIQPSARWRATRSPSRHARQQASRRSTRSSCDTMVLRDLYKKHHWQVSGPTFYSLHLLFDKHYEEQVELVDDLAERVQSLGGIAIAMAHDVAEMTKHRTAAARPRGGAGADLAPARRARGHPERSAHRGQAAEPTAMTGRTTSS